MNKILHIAVFTALAIFMGLTHGSIPPRGDLLLRFENGSGNELLVDSTCRKTAGDPYRIAHGSRAEIPLFFPGQTGVTGSGTLCKVICVDAKRPQKQAVMCLDENACEIGCNDSDCDEGVCDNIGLQWIRGCWGTCEKFCKPGVANCDICVRGSKKDGATISSTINYGVVHIKDTDASVARKLFDGGDVSDYLDEKIGESMSQTLIDKFGINKAVDFANAQWKFNEINALLKNDTDKNNLKNAFCSVALSHPLLINSGNTQAIFATKTGLCKGSDGYIPNAPGFQIKCSNGAKIASDGSECYCPAYAGKLTVWEPVSTDKQSGARRTHWGCR